jgi:hypothetical protein
VPLARGALDNDSRINCNHLSPLQLDVALIALFTKQLQDVNADLATYLRKNAKTDRIKSRYYLEHQPRQVSKVPLPDCLFLCKMMLIGE